jgi:hypothetical protein
MQKFELSVLKPVKGKPGKLMFEISKFANSISDAVKEVRWEVEGSGWIVVQSSSLKKLEPVEAVIDIAA